MAKSVPQRSSARKPATKDKGHGRAKPKKDAERDAFIESLVAHGQAVKVKPGETLPRGATHELKEDADGTLRVVRKRFSAI